MKRPWDRGSPRLARLAHAIVRRRWIVIGVWIVLTIFGAYAAGRVSDRWFESFSIPGYSSYEANQRTLKTFGTGEQAPLVAVFHSDGDVTKAKGMPRAVAAAAAVNPGSRTSSYFSTGSRAYVSKDGHTTFAEIYPPGTPTFSSSVHIKQVRAKLKAATPAGVQSYLTGRDPLYEASSGGDSGGPSVLTEAIIGGLGCLVILFFVFGTLPAVLIPLAIAIASILNTFTLVWLLTYVTNVSIIVQFLIALVGLGVAIDYALLMIFRFRDELREGEDVETSIVETMTHAGRSVIVSGSTVAVGLLSMLVIPLPFIRSIGIGGMLIPAVSVITAITLLPALLAVLGTSVNSLRLLPKRFVDRGHPEDGPWGRWARFVIRRPGPVAAVGLVIVGALVYCGVHLNPSEAQAKDFPGSGDAIQGRAALAGAGITAGRTSRSWCSSNSGDRQAVVERVAAVPGVTGAAAPPGWTKGRDGLVEAFPSADGAATQTRGTIKRVRAALKGSDAYARRPRRRGARLRRRRLLELPVRARLRGAADVPPARPRLPLDRAADQGGHAEPDLARRGLRDHRLHLPVGPRRGGDLGRAADPGDHPVDPADDLRLPVRPLDGLRGLHAHAHARDLRRDGRHNTAISLGLARTGKLVTSAALVLMFAFFVLSSSPGADIKQFGIGLAAGIIFDATVIRALLVPSLMRLFGEWNWWMPDFAAKALFVRPPRAPEQPALDSV